MIGCRRLEFRGTSGEYFFRISLACTREKPGYRTISASFGILPVITILSSKDSIRCMLNVLLMYAYSLSVETKECGMCYISSNRNPL